jgi:hypothetical protein
MFFSAMLLFQAYSSFFMTDQALRLRPEPPLHLNPWLGGLTLAYLPLFALALKFRWAWISLMFSGCFLIFFLCST